MYEIEDITYDMASDADSNYSAADLDSGNMSSSLGVSAVAIGLGVLVAYFAGEYEDAKAEFASHPAGRTANYWETVRDCTEEISDKLTDNMYQTSKPNIALSLIDDVQEILNSSIEDVTDEMLRIDGHDYGTANNMLDYLSEKAGDLEPLNAFNQTLSEVASHIKSGDYSVAKGMLDQLSEKAASIESSYISQAQDVYNNMILDKSIFAASLITAFAYPALLVGGSIAYNAMSNKKENSK